VCSRALEASAQGRQPRRGGALRRRCTVGDSAGHHRLRVSGPRGHRSLPHHLPPGFSIGEVRQDLCCGAIEAILGAALPNPVIPEPDAVALFIAGTQAQAGANHPRPSPCWEEYALSSSFQSHGASTSQVPRRILHRICRTGTSVGRSRAPSAVENAETIPEATLTQSGHDVPPQGRNHLVPVCSHGGQERVVPPAPTRTATPRVPRGRAGLEAFPRPAWRSRDRLYR
jgi:hypothetical protein